MAKLSSDAFASLRRRYRTQKSLRSPLDSLLDDIDYYTGPVKDSGSTAHNPQGGTGSNLEARTDLWDFTGINGREKLSASIYGSAMGNSYRWFFFAARNPALQKDQEVASWLSDESESVWNDVQDSDFNTEMPAALHELAGGGNCFVAMECIEGEPEEYEEQARNGKTVKKIRQSWEGVDFTSAPVRDCFFEPDRKGNVKTFWQRYMWMPSQIYDFCEDKGIEIPEFVKEKYEKAPDEKIEVVFSLFQRPEILKKKKVTFPAAVDMRPYGFVWWIELNGTRLGEEGGYYERPVFKGIWSKTAGSKWGHGPSNIALPTVKYVNAWKELTRASGEKAVDPALITSERNILSDVDYKAAGITLVRDVEAIKPLESNAKFDVAHEMLQEDQKSIRDIYHVDDLQLKDSPAMTATEAQIRYEWMMRLLGKTLGYIQTFLLAPIVLTILQMRIRTGAAKPMPEKLRKAGGLLNIEFQGPLARSQRTDEVAAIERGATFLAGLAQFYPEIKAAMDPVEAVKIVFNRLGIPANVIPPDAILKKKMQEILDSMQQAQQADTNQKNADAAQKHASAKEKSGGGAGAMGGTPGPVVYPQLPPKPALTPSGRPTGIPQ
jgi:hypothetical protein